jgi:uncharacterized protein
MAERIAIDRDWIANFCRRRRVKRLALFGSVLRDDFGPDSDVDILIEFQADARASLFDFVRMRDELSGHLGRSVDLVDERGLRNPFRRRAIAESSETLYAA